MNFFPKNQPLENSNVVLALSSYMYACVRSTSIALSVWQNYE